jgi:DNA-binding transcriptional LysR family regulator
VLRLGSFTRAGESLGLSQPAVSQSLARLRRVLGDPLFVRSGQRVLPTPRALALGSPVRRLLELAREEFAGESRFEPASSSRIFGVFASDIGMLLFLPRILGHLRQTSSGIRINAMAVGAGNLRDGLESGEADLAVGAYPKLGAGFFQQRLYEDPYVCLVSADHPSIRARMTRRQFLSARHAVVSAGGTGHGHARAEHALQELIPAERIAVRIPGFVAAPMVIAGSDLVVTVPNRVAQTLASRFALRVFASPVPLPAVVVRQYWHQRFHHDQANRWLRSLIANLFAAP